MSFRSVRRLFMFLLLLTIIVISGYSAESPMPERKVKIPEKVVSYITNNFPGWEIPASADYIKSWWSFYDRSQVPYFVATDFNDDRIADYGLILKKGDALCLVFLIGNKSSYTHWIADNFNKKFNARVKDLKYGLTLETPGRIDIAYPKINSLILKSNAINLMEFEMRSCVYYWSEGKIAVFQTN